MKVSRKDQGHLTTIIDITIEKSDYQGKFKSELNKIRDKAVIKGFRQGKTPMSIIQKMYGQNLLAETVNKVLQDKMKEAIEEEKIKLVASPFMTDEQVNYEFSPKDLQDYTFSFEIGMVPEYDLKGADETSSITDYKIVVDEDIINKELDAVRKRMGSETSVKKDINDEDRIVIEAVEVDDKGKKITKGWETGFQVLINTLDEEYKKELIGKDKGHEFLFDINKLEKNRDEKYVKQYLLNLDEGEEKEILPTFRGKIKDILRIELAEVDQVFLDKYLGEGEAKTEQDAKDKIKENISGYYEGQTKVFLHRNIMDKLIEENNFDLPNDYLKKWIKVNNETATEEQIESEFEQFVTNVRWDIISSNLKESLKVEVGVEDVRTKVRAQVQQYLGGQMAGMDLEPIIDNIMQDQKQVSQAYQEASSEKLLGAVADKITLIEEEISIEKFGEMVKAMNEKLKGEEA